MAAILIILIPLLPFLAFLANGLLGRRLGRTGGWLAVAAMGGSALIGLGFFAAALTGRLALPIDVTLWNWIAVGKLAIPIQFHVDQLTCLMLAFVTLVSTLVFLYSMGYMAGDPGFNRFFAYLCLFDFSMLILVLGASLPLLFVGWEGVGLCSYLLIGYYLAQPGAADAGKKAFIVNRIGDFGFLVAMFILFTALGTLNIQEIVQAAANGHPALKAGGATVTILTLALFLGCTGKSAQIPLFVWLPDAMAGPTPVSALIHAATMVTAGVYLVVRLAGLFALAPATMLTMAIVAAATAFVAGTIAMTQRDIKKVLAYSTVSQLGFMFLACGLGAFTAGIFHVFTHAFFKACLFLGAGSVIHAAHHEQDLFRLGGLKKKMPQTWATFAIACLAIAGIPPLAGFFSKDAILWTAFSSGMWPLWALGVATALMTACYTFRALFLAFHGECRLDEHTRHHLHESPWTMTLPLWILAAGALAAGALNLTESGLIGRFLEPIVGHAQQVYAAAHAQVAENDTYGGAKLEHALMGFSVLVAVAGIALAWFFCLRGWPQAAGRAAARFGPLYRLSFYRWWWDDIYNVVIVGGLRRVAAIATWLDRTLIDGVLGGIAEAARSASREIRSAQSGQVQAYALAILFGVNVILFIILFW